MGSSHFSDIICPRGMGGAKMLDLQIFVIIDFVAAGGISVAQTHV